MREIVLQDFQGASSIYITWRNPTNGSETLPYSQKFLLKEKKKKKTLNEWEKYFQGGSGESQSKKDRQKLLNMKERRFTAYFGLGHFEYRADIKQICAGMTRVVGRTGHQWKHMALWFTCRRTSKASHYQYNNVWKIRDEIMNLNSKINTTWLCYRQKKFNLSIEKW